jgi:hypothetical protein
MPVIGNKQFFSRNIRILFRQGAGLSLTTHARAMLCTARDLRRLRLREIVGTAGITGRGTHSIATDLAEAGHVPQARRRPDQPPPDPGLPAAARTPPARNVPSGSHSTSSRARARTPPVKAVPPRPGPASEPPPTVTSPPPSPCGLAACQSGHGALQARPTRNGERATARFREWPPSPETRSACLAPPPDHLHGDEQLSALVAPTRSPWPADHREHERGNHP